VTPCNIVVGYQYFGGPYCFHLQGEMNGIMHQVYLCLKYMYIPYIAVLGDFFSTLALMFIYYRYCKVK